MLFHILDCFGREDEVVSRCCAKNGRKYRSVCQTTCERLLSASGKEEEDSTCMSSTRGRIKSILRQRE